MADLGRKANRLHSFTKLFRVFATFNTHLTG